MLNSDAGASAHQETRSIDAGLPAAAADDHARPGGGAPGRSAPHNQRMPALPFTPAPVSVDVATPLGVEAAVDLLARAIDEQRYVEPRGEDRGWLRLGAARDASGLAVAAHRYRDRDVPERAPMPLTFTGALVEEEGGSRLVGSIVAPITSALWLVPGVSFALGLTSALNGNPLLGVAGIGFATVAYAVFRLNQWDLLRDAGQLRRALGELLAADLDC